MSRLIASLLNFPSPAIASRNPEEAALLAQLRAGSETAFDSLVEQHTAMCYRLAHRLLHNPQDAPDVVQEVFLKVFRGIGSFHGDCSLKTWIYRITLTSALNQNRWWFRHHRRENSLDAPLPRTVDEYLDPASDSPGPFDLTLSRETQALVQQALERLDEPHRAILVLREMEECSYDEIAEILEISIGTVKSRIARARAALREQLRSLQPAEATEPLWDMGN